MNNKENNSVNPFRFCCFRYAFVEYFLLAFSSSINLFNKYVVLINDILNILVTQVKCFVRHAIEAVGIYSDILITLYLKQP